MNCAQTGSKTTFTFRKLMILVAILTFCVGIAQSKNPKKKAIPLHPASMSTSETGARNPISSYGSLPLSFEANEGQADAAVKYISHGNGYAFFLTSTTAVMAFDQKETNSTFLQKLDPKTRKRWEGRKVGRRLTRVKNDHNQIFDLSFEGAKPDVRIEALDEVPGKSNYFIGNDPKKWLSGVPNYTRVRYVALYPGIDLIYYGKEGHLEFDFVISPGANPNAIVLKFDSRERVRITGDGNLKIGAGTSTVLLHRPSIYQVEPGKKSSVQGSFVLLASKRVGFHVGAYNLKEPLIVDPVLSYSTFLDGNAGNGLSGIAVDSIGDGYVVGSTISTDLPIVNGYQSGGITNFVASVTKFDPTGTKLLYSTYLGGTGESYGTGIAIDDSGNAYVTGYTFTTAFPIVNGFQTTNNNPNNGNAFVARIDTTQVGGASLVYSSYLGGGGDTSSPWGDSAYGIATDRMGRAYLTGQTTSDSSIVAFPTTSGAYQSTLPGANGSAFLTVVDTNQVGAPSLIYSTYLGGDAAGPYGDYGTGVTVDSSGNAYLVGQTTSDASGPFPTTAGAFQTTLRSPNGAAFATEIAPSLSSSESLLFSSYLGGSTTNSAGDYGGAIALDSTGKVYVVGDATSTDFPVTAGAFQSTNGGDGRAFVTKLDLSQTGAQVLVYSTFLGGTNGDGASAVAVNANGNTFVTGVTHSSDFPLSSDAFQSTLKNTNWTAFVSELSSDGTNLLYSTFLGGSLADASTGVALDTIV